ncbi:MAG: RNA polymerase sigma factor [Singulisphaera sp.]
MDLELLGHLLDRHSAALELYARQWCETPDDVVQEAFLKLAGQGVLPSHPAAWLFRVVRNGAIAAGRSALRRRRHEARAAVGATPWFEPAGAVGEGGLRDPEMAAAALRAWPLEQREVIVAHLWGGLTFEQIAEVAGCSSSTAHRSYSAGLATLRRRLGESCRTSRPTPK